MIILKSLGFAIKKNELWYTGIEGTEIDNAKIVAQGKHNFQSASETAQLMQSFYNLFNEIISEINPDTVSCKLSLGPDLKQIPYMHFSIGVLAYLCNQKNIPFVTRSSAWIVAGKRKKELLCISKFPNYKLTNEKLHSTVVALFQLGG